MVQAQEVVEEPQHGSHRWCPTLRPTRQQFQRPFTDFVSEVFGKNPELAMFKVVPPPGWRARRRQFPDLKNVQINTPIRQHVFGSRGVYRCILVEQKEMDVDTFQRQAAEELMAAPGLNRRVKETLDKGDTSDADALMERAFWSGVTLNPPLYGADTPISFFDERLAYGWNLRDLGDLLKTKDVPDVPGVTTPMTYFGMWRSFFGWHKEDADLLSINFMHFGAPKWWYCVSPKDQGKFERMAESLFPELRRACSAFIRHKDILLSPSLLRTHGIDFVQAKQEAGEFIVLNASAYHSGFNMGFNCAEAINFATDSWVEVGKAANACTCRRDAVHISMKLFDPEWTDGEGASSSSAAESEEIEEAEEEEVEQEAETEVEEETAESEEDEEEEVVEEVEAPPAKRTKRVEPALPVAPPALPWRLGAGHGRVLKGAGVLPGAPQAAAAYAPLVLPPDAEKVLAADVVMGPPLALLGVERGRKFFVLVERVRRTGAAAPPKGHETLRWLRPGPDGLFRPVPVYWTEARHALVGVRTAVASGAARRRGSMVGVAAAGADERPKASARLAAKRTRVEASLGGGWRLLTPPERLLETQLPEDAA